MVGWIYMDKKDGLPKKVKGVILVSFSMCPFCKSDTQDKRYKMIISSGCRIRRWSRLVIVQECKTCGLRFSMGWKSIRNVLTKKLEKAKTKQEKIWYRNQLDIITLWLMYDCDAYFFNEVLKT